MNLDDYRKDIDIIDRELVRLLGERLELAYKIVRLKEKKNLPIQDTDRENQKLAKLKSLCHEKDLPYLQEILKEIMVQSKRYQEDYSADYGLLGKSLEHSLSADIHGLISDYDYTYFEREEEDLADFVLKGRWKGINVTAPYKRRIMSFCNEISDTATICRSVNTVIRRENGTLYGDNTDYFGFRYTVEKSGVKVRGSKVIVLGSGGVSGTLRRVLEDMGAAGVSIISRGGPDNYKNLEAHMDADIIVNATPVGMYPNRGESPIDLKGFSRCTAVFDLIYNPLRTKLLLQAKELGIPAFGGLHMLVAQAVEACRIFTGKAIGEEDIDRVYRKIRSSRENIILIGMPGCGKTSIGIRTAELLGIDFIDTDNLIKITQGRSPEEILLSEGEKKFREIETAVLSSAIERGDAGVEPVVISCGGGIVERSENLYVIGENSSIVYIMRDIKDLAEEGRPISARDGLKDIFNRRDVRYRGWSDIRIKNTGIEESARKIINQLRESCEMSRKPLKNHEK